MQLCSKYNEHATSEVLILFSQGVVFQELLTLEEEKVRS